MHQTADRSCKHQCHKNKVPWILSPISHNPKNNNSQPISAISSLTSSEKAAGGTGVAVSTAVAGGTGVVVSTAVVLPLESKYSSNDVQDARSSQIRLCQSTGSIPGVSKPTNKNLKKCEIQLTIPAKRDFPGRVGFSFKQGCLERDNGDSWDCLKIGGSRSSTSASASHLRFRRTQYTHVTTTYASLSMSLPKQKPTWIKVDCG